MVQLQIKQQQREAQYFTEALSNTLGLDMMLIPGGTFRMGSPPDELGRYDDEGPQHVVSVPTFFLGRYPVTQAQWKIVAGWPKAERDLTPNPSHFKNKPDHPVEQISWYDADEFCRRLAVKTGRPYRLPSEAEWEYACRAGTTTPFHFGETITTDLANYRGIDSESEPEKYPGHYGRGPKGIYRKTTTPVGSLGGINAFGLADMHGNVLEWCQDHWHENYEGAPTDGSPWLTEKENNLRVRRGGSWASLPRICRSAFRNWDPPDYRYNNYGFRVACATPRTL